MIKAFGHLVYSILLRIYGDIRDYIELDDNVIIEFKHTTDFVIAKKRIIA